MIGRKDLLLGGVGVGWGGMGNSEVIFRFLAFVVYG